MGTVKCVLNIMYKNMFVCVNKETLMYKTEFGRVNDDRIFILG